MRKKPNSLEILCGQQLRFPLPPIPPTAPSPFGCLHSFRLCQPPASFYIALFSACLLSYSPISALPTTTQPYLQWPPPQTTCKKGLLQPAVKPTVSRKKLELRGKVSLIPLVRLCSFPSARSQFGLTISSRPFDALKCPASPCRRS